jgi:hypothetical protein
MRRPIGWFTCAVSALALLSACDRSTGDAPPESAATSVSPSPDSSATVGLSDPNNRKEVVALAERALACPWSEPVGIDGSNCPALAAWTESDLVQGAESDATLLAMLADRRDAVRWLAGLALSQLSRPPRKDAPSAERLLQAAVAEKSPRVALELGGAVALVDLEATGIEGRTRDILQGDSLLELRRGLASRVLKSNPKLFDLVLGLARTARDPELRASSVWGLRFAPAEKLPEVYDLWLARADDGDPDVADDVFLRCSTYDACRGIWDRLLTKLEARRATPTSTGLLLRTMLAETNDEAKRARIVKIATRIVEDESQDDVVRTMTLAALWNAKVPAARVLAEKLQSSPRSLVQQQAKEILQATQVDAAVQ